MYKLNSHLDVEQLADTIPGFTLIYVGYNALFLMFA